MPDVRPLDAYETVARSLDAHPCVRATDVTERLTDPDRLLVEVVLEPGVERVPPDVLRTIGSHDFGVGDVSPRGSPRHLVVEVV